LACVEPGRDGVGGVAVEGVSASVVASDGGSEDRPVTSAAFAVEPEDPVASVVAEVFDVSGQRLTDA